MPEGLSKWSPGDNVDSKEAIQARQKMIKDGGFGYPKRVRDVRGAMGSSIRKALEAIDKTLQDSERAKASGVSYNPADVLDTLYYSKRVGRNEKPALFIIQNPKATDPNRKYVVLAQDESHFRDLHNRHFASFDEAQEASISALRGFIDNAGGFFIDGSRSVLGARSSTERESTTLSRHKSPVLFWGDDDGEEGPLFSRSRSTVSLDEQDDDDIFGN